jgi:serine/threonine protein kinase
MNGLHEIISCIREKIDLKPASNFITSFNDIILNKKSCDNLIPLFNKHQYLSIGNDTKILVKEDEFIFLLELLGKGTYANVYKVLYNKKYYTVKMNYNKDSLEEYIIHIILYCLHDKLQSSIHMNFLQPFPLIKTLFLAESLQKITPRKIKKVKNEKLRKCLLDLDWKNIDKTNKKEQKKEQSVCMMEKLDITLVDLLKTIDAKTTINILIQISYQLYCLQESIGFIHGDLHTENVMLKKEKFVLDIHIDDFHHRSVQEYRIYFIDLGYASLDSSKCKDCHIPNLNLINPYYDNYSGNMSHDMRLLIINLYVYVTLDNKIWNYFDDILSKYKNKEPHDYYGFDLKDTDFLPLNIMNKLSNF